jgi:hypothetical protein
LSSTISIELGTGGIPVAAASDFRRLLGVQVASPPEKPSIRLRGPVSPDLQELLMSCLAKQPAERLASADAFEASSAKCVAVRRTRVKADEW